jgi:hypothetical protein
MTGSDRKAPGIGLLTVLLGAVAAGPDPALRPQRHQRFDHCRARHLRSPIRSPGHHLLWHRGHRQRDLGQARRPALRPGSLMAFIFVLSHARSAAGGRARRVLDAAPRRRPVRHRPILPQRGDQPDPPRARPRRQADRLGRHQTVRSPGQPTRCEPRAFPVLAIGRRLARRRPDRRDHSTHPACR